LSAAAIHASLEWGGIDEDNNTNSVQNKTINNNSLGGTGHAKDHTSGSTNIDHHVGIPEGDLEHHQTINAHTTAETDTFPALLRGVLDNHQYGYGTMTVEKVSLMRIIKVILLYLLMQILYHMKMQLAVTNGDVQWRLKLQPLRKTIHGPHRSSSWCNNNWGEMDI
jgi:hypothetical protein